MRPSLLAMAARSTRGAAFWTLAGIAVALAGPALAGPVTTSTAPTTTTTTTTTATSPTTTTTTATSPTTTTTTGTGPTTTTTTGTSPTTTTTTATAPTTTTTSTTVATTTTTTALPITTTTTTAPPTTTTTTTTTTTLRENFEGQTGFVDSKSPDALQSLLNVDTGLGQVCVAGFSQFFNETVTLTDDVGQPAHNTTVTFSFDAIGTIDHSGGKKLSATFTTVNLTLDITEPRSPANGGPLNFYNQTIQVTCKGRATLNQPGGFPSSQRTLDGVTLDCDLGKDFAAFNDVSALVNPNDSSQSLLPPIDSAYLHRNRVTANTRSGRLRIRMPGVEVLPGDGRTINIASCDFPD